jgi:hypothetical protein
MFGALISAGAHMLACWCLVVNESMGGKCMRAEAHILLPLVDPVATIAIMSSKELNCEPNLYSLVAPSFLSVL